MPEKLRPCPFCGEKADTRGGSLSLWWIECTECPAEFGAYYDEDGCPEGEFDTEAEAIAAWNKRHREEVRGG